MKKKVILISIMVLFMAILTQKSYAAIEIKPSATASASGVFTNSSVSNSYLLCQKMTEKGESLYGSTVVPHLSTNKDWGAVSYLANSIYGTNSEGKNTGVKLENINGVAYYSTTKNVTGVMNWGANCYNGNLYTQTASLMKKYKDNVPNYENGKATSTARDNVIELEKAALNSSRFVEVIPTDGSNFTTTKTAGMALAETKGYPWGQWPYAGTDENYPIAIRQGLFGFDVGGGSYGGNTASGAGSGYATFRPVIWNK